MQYLHIFSKRGDHLVTIKTNTPEQSARRWMRENNKENCSWYAAKTADI